MKPSKYKKLLFATGVSLILRILGAAAALTFQFFLARKAGVTGTGAYYFTVSIILILATVSRLGFDKIVPKYIAINRMECNDQNINSFIFLSTIIILFTSAIVGIGFDFTVSLLDIRLINVEFKEPLKNSAHIIIFVSLMWLFAGFLVGLKESALASFVQTVVTPIVAIFYITVVSSEVDGVEAVRGFGYGSITAMIIGLLLIKLRIPRWWEFNAKTLAFNSKILLSDGFPIMLSNLSAQFTIYLPVLILGVFSTAEDTGLFSVAHRTALATTIVLFASNVILAPRVAAMWSENDKLGIQKTSQLVALLMLCVSLPLFFPMIFYPSHTMGFFGIEFRSGAQLLMIIAISQLFNVATSSIGVVMTMTGYEKAVMNTSFIATVVCGLLCLVLVPMYGAIGAAYGSAVSTVLLHSSRVYIFFKGTGIVVVPGYRSLSRICS